MLLVLSLALVGFANGDRVEEPGSSLTDTDDNWTKNYWNEWIPESGNEIGAPIDIEELSGKLRKSVAQLKENNEVELVFLIDSSSSIGNANFQSELKFVRKLLADFKVGPSDTRVAIVVYASSAETHVNHLEGVAHDKCTLLHSELPGIEYTGGNTDTIGALLKAREILSESREGAARALFLLTDGFSNKGDPIPTAEELKHSGITIFTFGIQTGNVREVREMSSKPNEDYSFILESFSQFEALVRRALHEDLKSGTYVPLNSTAPCDGLCAATDTGCCNSQSRCSCGILTGHFSCLCPPGFYGSGLAGEECLPCPSGTYHDGTFPGDVLVCAECPDANHVTVPPAATKEDCVCKEGYTPVGDTCQVAKCPAPTAPKNGYFVKKNCSNVVHAACGVRCRTGYKLHGSSVRICQANGTWSGVAPACVPKTCKKPKPVRDSIVTCRNHDYGTESVTRHDSRGNLLETSLRRTTDSATDAPPPEFNYTVDTTCDFHCLPGYTTIGSRSRTCLPILQWNGLATSCTVIICPSLSMLEDGFISPENCTVGGLRHGFATECSVSCNPGYRLEGPTKRKCTGRRGTWTGKNVPNKCIDVEPPVFTCPENITVETAEEESYALVNLSLPQGTDNSGREPIIWSKPPFLPDRPLPLQVGTTKIEVFGTDASDNGDLCEFYVEVRDKEVPKIYHCESPPTIYLSDLDSDGSEVNWTEPIFVDNSRTPLSIERSHDFGNFSVGTTRVVYTVTDASGNSANCTLNITIAENPCIDRPHLGSVMWNCSAAARTLTCRIACPPGLTWTTSNDLTNTTLVCQYDRRGAVWSPDVFSDMEAIPECSVFELPTTVTESHEIELEGEDANCEDLQKLSNEISNEISVFVESDEIANISIVADCIDDETDDLESTEGEPSRKKREAPIEEEMKKMKKRKKGKKRIRIRINITGSSSNQTSPQDVKRRLQDLGQKVDNEYGKNSFITLGGKKMKVHDTRLESPAKITCNKGFALRRGLCVKCPRGTFYDSSTSNCAPCPIGTFQHEDGQLQCTPCPAGHLTRRRRRKHPQDCKKICPPGTFGRRKNELQKAALEPCTPCPIGSYQPFDGQTSCLECPGGKTTRKKGSQEMEQCIDSTAIDDPCYQFTCMNGGTCSSYNGYPYCSCPDGYVGSLCEKLRNHCDSSPCYNSGECIPEGGTGFSCVCPRGYEGDLCQYEVNECASNPCANGAECIDLLLGYKCECPSGFTGENCEEDIDECQMLKPCLNGGICRDAVNGYDCICTGGFSGSHCEEMSECSPDERVDKDCNVKLPEWSDPCSGVLCPPNMECTTARGRVKYPQCTCREGYFGKNCSEVNFNVILTFPKRSVTEYIAASLGEEAIGEISVCVWMQTSDDFNYGTLFSYAVGDDDNAFTVTDYKGFVLYVGKQRVVTDIVANDGHWHFVCITWSSREGRWEVYLDGERRGHGLGLSANATIPGNGRFIIGQEQDRFGGGFNELESFVGRITHFDVWNRVLEKSEVQDMNENCEYFKGSLLSWVQILENIHGDVQIETSTFCTNCNARGLRMLNGRVSISIIGQSTFAVYECDKGYRIRIGDGVSGDSRDVNIWYRKCLKHGNWEAAAPSCERVSCGFPGYIPNGTIIGNSYLFMDEIQYQCQDGYDLVGNSTRTCLENGLWSGYRPSCEGNRGFCEDLKAPSHGSMVVSHGGERNSRPFAIGDRVGFLCDEGYKRVGAETLICTEDGFWDQAVPTCEEIFCPRPEGFHDYVLGSPAAEKFTVGAKLEVKCDELDEVQAVYCEDNGSWNFTGQICGSKCKLKPRYPEFGLLLGDPLRYIYQAGERVYIKCRYGYKLYGDDFFSCTRNGTWHQENKTKCRPIECVAPIPPPNAYSAAASNNYPYGKRVQFKCLPGYFQRGDLLTRCDGEGKWTKLYGVCVGGTP